LPLLVDSNASEPGVQLRYLNTKSVTLS
jgi:hypothetical protein